MENADKHPGDLIDEAMHNMESRLEIPPAQHTPDYLTEAGLEAHNRFNALVAEKAKTLSLDAARQILSGFEKARNYLEGRMGGQGMHRLLIDREAAKTVTAKATGTEAA